MKMLCGELTAVVCYTGPYGIPVTDQGASSSGSAPEQLLAPSAQLSPIAEVYAREEWLRFYHKSFFDFIYDPIRSGPFCVTTKTMRSKLFEHILELQIGSFQSNGM
jgi:ABC-type multidrug transport system fused ATPase/permease subunit